MVHTSVCSHCIDEKGEGLAIGEVQPELYAICICPKKHITISLLSTDLFEVLYKSAVEALLKNFFSQSIMSFTASLERLYEQFIKVQALKSGVEISVIDKFWNEIQGQSERQYGAFCLSYAQATNKPWRNDEKMVGFRNKVIHKGYIAGSEEVKKYATYITDRLTEIMHVIKESFGDEQKRIYVYEKQKAHPKLDQLLKENPNAKVGHTFSPSLLGWNVSNFKRLSFEQVLEMAEYQINRYGRIR